MPDQYAKIVAKSKVKQIAQNSLSSEEFLKEAIPYGMKAYQTIGFAMNNLSNADLNL